MISICIPTYNQNEMTAECIQAVMETTSNYEVIVVDNGSDPPFQPPFSGFNEIRVIRNETNEGFPVAVNQAIATAKGETIILLNNDVTVTPGAMNRLASWLDHFDIIGPVTNFAAGMQRVHIESYQSIDELNTEAEALAESNEGEAEEVNWIIGFCMAFKKSLFDDVGAFDESLWPCSGEEVDFCLRSKEKGYTVAIAYDTYVHHEGSVTFRDMEDAGQLKYTAICERNNKHLQEKWKMNFWDNQAIDGKEEQSPKTGLNLNIGCGYAHADGFINIDNRPEVNPDLVCDVLNGLPYDDSTVDSIMAHDFLEHIPIGKTIAVMDEIWRVLKPGGIFDSFTPDAEFGQAAFQDPTHVSFWVQNSWLYYSDSDYRALYGTKANFEIQSLKRIESNNRVFHLRVVAKAVK